LVIAVLLVVVGPPGPSAGRPDHDQQHCYNQAPTVSQRRLLQLLLLLMMGVRIPEKLEKFLHLVG
jgi:hypothetical protein